VNNAARDRSMIPVAAWCKVWVYGRSLFRTAGSNRAGDIDVCCGQVEISASG
jgi:hypothetical protein